MHALLPIPGKRDSDWSYAWIPVIGPILGGPDWRRLFGELWCRGKRDILERPFFRRHFLSLELLDIAS